MPIGFVSLTENLMVIAMSAWVVLTELKILSVSHS
jgi:hypothetical protein